MLGLRLDGYEPDLHHDAAVAFCIQAREDELFSPLHQHRKGQLITALHGAITCEVENAMWMVPPQYAVWITAKFHTATTLPWARNCVFCLLSRRLS